MFVLFVDIRNIRSFVYSYPFSGMLTNDSVFCYDSFHRNLMHNQDKRDSIIYAIVTESLPNTMFRVKRDDNGEEMLTYLSGKMRLHRIRVLIGDRVAVEVDPYGGKGRIVKRV